MQKEINCPQCGNLLPFNFRYTRQTVCSHCDSTLYIEDDAARYAGYQSVVSDVPGLVQLKQPFDYQNQSWLPVGVVRYRYEHGFWDEWWAINNAGEGVWISVDEGDYAFEKKCDASISSTLPEWESLSMGKSVLVGEQKKSWLVTELGTAVCEGFKGELPETFTKGEIFKYVHLSERMGGLMTLEYQKEGLKCFVGQWIDHYEMNIAHE